MFAFMRHITFHNDGRTGIPACIAASLALMSMSSIRPAALIAQTAPLTLEQAVAAAFENNERSAAANERITAAAHRVSRVRAAFLPSLIALGTYNRRPFENVRSVGGEEITIQSLNAFSAAANASMTLLEPRLFALLSQAKSERDAATVDSRDNIRMLAFETATAYLVALGASDVTQAAERRLAYASSHLAASRARFDAQLTGINDVTRAELELATAERERTYAQSELDAALLYLHFLTGITHSDSLVPPIALLKQASEYSPDIVSLVEKAKSTRPDVMAARYRADALRSFASEAWLRTLPNLTATGQYRITNEAGFSGRSWNWYLGVNLSWTLLDGGAWLSDRAERDALSRAASLEQAQTERKVELDIRTAFASLESARAALAQADAALTAARKTARENRELYHQGLSTTLQASDAGVRLFEADATRARQNYALAFAFLNLRAASGLDPFGNELTTMSN